MEEKKEFGMKESAGAEELNIEELSEVTGGLTRKGKELIRRRVLESKEEFMHIFDNVSHLTLMELETTRADLLRYMNKAWDTANV